MTEPGVYRHPTALVETTAIGDGTRIWAFAHVMDGARVGRRCNIGDQCFVEAGAVIGDDVTVKNGVSVWAHVRVEDGVFLGPNVALTNDRRPRSRAPWTPVPTVIATGATIGANATIVCGCDIGAYAMIGAGAVVTKPVPPHALVVGNPGRVVGYVCACGERLLTRGATAQCRACPRRYRRHAGRWQEAGAAVEASR
ncbi:MAG: N-acetyltransferase [Candidatus Rokubacteria bacterium]|nr:N-acetyltransferase [Candidatus Rokubacteria bacterium]